MNVPDSSPPNAASLPSSDTWTRPEQDAVRAARDPVLTRMLAEERVESSTFDRTLLWRILGYVRPHKGVATIAVGLAFLDAGLMTLPPWLIGVAVDQVMTPEGSQRTAWATAWTSAVAGVPATTSQVILLLGVLAALVWAVRWGVGFVGTYNIQKLSQRVVHDLRRDVYDHITGMDMGFFQKNPVGRLVNRATFDVQTLSELFGDALAEGMRDVLFVALLIAFMLVLDVPLALTLIAAFPFLGLCAWAYKRMSRPAMRTMSAVQSRMNAWMAENLAGMRENQLYDQEARRVAEFDALTQAHQASMVHVIRTWGFVRPAMMLVSAIATTGVLLIGYERVLAGVLSVGVLVTFLQYTTRLWVPVRNLAEKLNLIQQSLTSAERIADVLDARAAMTDGPDADPSLQLRAGALAFESVSFRYPGKDLDVLSNLSFLVEPGKMLALVGDTGAGKSTIAHLIARFYDTTTGRVMLDGRDVRDFTLHGLRQGLAIVPQEVVLFAGDLRDNVTLGREVSDDRIREALDAVRAGDLVDRLPGGLRHVFTEGGRTVSAGERQLISFARALVAEPAILILDEATANVDTETEARIQEALQTLTAGRTSVVIAHRLSTIRNADQILVLRHGQIVERGTHDGLLAQNGEYARLYRLHLRAQDDNVAQ